jgi:class 3 adenylate cyclase/ribosomal protein L40E
MAMKCPKCQHENPDGAKFCMECGDKLDNVCPKCGAKLSPEAKFCMECGSKVSESDVPNITIPKLEDMHAQLQSLIPDILAQKYLSAEQQITAGENRPITALFADISGFTPLSATKSSETIFHLVQDCFKQLVSIVAKYEGSISGFRGDGLLALFGAPILHENDAERAILSAIDMRKMMEDRQLGISIGINTAMMTVGEIQTQLHSEYTAYGTDINLAKRLQESAEPEQILVGSGTHRLTRRAFDFEIISDLTMKGFTQSVTAYSVKQAKTHPEKIRGIEGLRARMIGREHEFTEVKESVDEWLSGQGQMVSIIGEAGIGKSRLVSELKTYLHTINPSNTPLYPLSRGEISNSPLTKADKGRFFHILAHRILYLWGFTSSQDSGKKRPKGNGL